MAMKSEAYVYCRSIPGIEALNPAEVIRVLPFFECVCSADTGICDELINSFTRVLPEVYV